MEKMRKKLTSTPFVRWLEYGQNYDGYWNYHHMIVQFEDIVDVLKVLYSNQYDFIFYFDHSSGHDRLRPDGLSEKTMNKMYGGTQNKMRDTTIQDDTYLGLFSHPERLKVGQVQSMQFQPYNDGPFYLSPAERECKKNDIKDENVEKKTYT